MIDKNFYLENLSAFDILINEDREKAREVIFRVYCILQRDKIWLNEVATEEEIFDDEVELLQEVEEELTQLDEQYDFKFDDFYRLVQQELKKRAGNPEPLQEEEEDDFDDEEESDDDLTTDDYDEMYEYDDEFDDDDEDDHLSHISDEELDEVTGYILKSAKNRLDYSDLMQDFPGAEEIFIDEEFLMPLIAGKAYGETDTEIAEPMLLSLQEFGYRINVDDLSKMIAETARKLGSEILAFKIAADSLQQGADPIAVIGQISTLLKI